MFLRLLCENFVRGGVRCDASNRLLRNSSRDRPDVSDEVLCSSRWCPWVILSHENTCSEYRIPPQNTPRKIETNQNTHVLVVQKKKDTLEHEICFDFSGGILWRNPVLPTPPTPRRPHFFPIFPWFLGFPLLNQRIFRDFWVPGGGVNFPVFFQNLPWICAYGAWL